MQTDSQSDQILRYLKRRGSITAAQAIKHMGCYRLAARIYDLRRKGFEILTVLEKTKKRSGAYAKYVYRGLAH